MKILALESSATACSVALCEGDKLLTQAYQNNGLTHSVTLMPMVQSVLAQSNCPLADVDVIAVAVGPGSFTGLRIGVSTAKGLAFAAQKPCAPCSTLTSMAWLLAHMEGEICAVMDARRNQVYNARFLAHNGTLTRLTPDRAISLADLAEEIKNSKNPQFLVGDGAQLCYNTLSNQGITLHLPPPHLHFQSAWGVARCGLDLAECQGLVDGGQVVPIYHRLSQAERERLEKGV